MNNEFQNETLIETIEYKGYKVEVWNDDYGQCYFFKFTDRKGETHEQSCGTYNAAYVESIHDYIDYFLFDGTLRENLQKRYEMFKNAGNPLFAKMYEGLFEHLENYEDDEKYMIRQIERQIYELTRWTDVEIDWRKKKD